MDKVKDVSEKEIEELSQELFGKPSKDLKFLICTNYIHEQLLEEEVTRTGLYQWLNVFKGEIKKPRDVKDFNDYDIVQVNLSAQDIHMLGDIKKQLKGNNNTKLVGNNDYTTEMWQSAFEYPTTVERELQFPDMLFGTEYFQCSALSELCARRISLIPHPADVRRLKSIPKIPQKNIISTIWRRYDNFSWIPHLVVRNHGLVTQLIGYDKSVDQKTHITTILYDYVLEGTNYFEFCEQLMESKIIYDPFTWHSYSRATVDTAALGVPVVGTNRTQSMQVCYPYTIVDPYDVTRARELIIRLLKDKKFYKQVVETALERVEFYNHKSSKYRYLVALKEAQEEKRESREIKRAKPEKGVGDEIDVKKQNNEKKDKRKGLK